jgi:stage IV sporulation protein FB
MTFRFGQAEARISMALLPLAVFCIVTGEVTELLCATLALLVHEAAHAIAAKNAGFRIERIAFYPFGAVMKLDGGPIDRDLFWTVAAAGPVCSLTAAGILQLVKPLFGASEITALLIRVNLAIGLINLLPAYPLDGGRILCAALLKTLRERTARAVALILTALLSLIMTGIGILLIIRGKPVRGIVAVPAFLLTAAIREWRIPKTGTVARVMERRDALKTGTPQRTVTYTVPDHFIVGDAVALLSERCYTVFRVRTKSNIFELDEGDILDAAAKFGMQEPLKTVIRD